MDRDTQWGRVEKEYDAIVYGEGPRAECPVKAVEESYATRDEDGKFLTDEFVIPTVCAGGAPLRAGDSFIFFNFRPDRARELTRALVDPDFSGFARREGRCV